MSRLLEEDLLQVRAPGVNFHVLKEGNDLYLVDAGFVGARPCLQKALVRAGWQKGVIRGILVTHGHLDHAFNVARIAEETGAWVAAPRMDQTHLDGRYNYRGISRVCGLMETTGRMLFGYQVPKVTQWLDDDSKIPVWGGLEAIHLPGHTRGHMGFYSQSRKLLFTGDLFASSLGRAWLPPPIFNSCPEQIPSSLRKVLDMDCHGLIPNHGDPVSPEEHGRRFRRRWGLVPSHGSTP